METVNANCTCELCHPNAFLGDNGENIFGEKPEVGQEPKEVETEHRAAALRAAALN